VVRSPETRHTCVPAPQPGGPVPLNIESGQNDPKATQGLRRAPQKNHHQKRDAGASARAHDAGLSPVFLSRPAVTRLLRFPRTIKKKTAFTRIERARRGGGGA